MKSFLLKLSLFFSVIALGLYPLDYLISKSLVSSKYYASGEISTWKDIYAGQIKSDLVIYGSSRAWVHISPKIIDDSLHLNTYNLGVNGHNFKMQYFRHKEFLKYNQKPKHIILSVDIYSFKQQDDLYNYEQFLPFLLYNKDIRNFTSTYNGFSFTDKYVPMMRYFGKSDVLLALLNNIFNFNKESREKGYRGMEREWNDDFDKAKSENNNFKMPIDKEVITLFENFIKECKQNNIRLTLVFTPEYIEGQEYVTNRDDIIKIYQDFSKKYHIKFIDYSNSEICMHKQYFYNATHLNKKGSELFTHFLIKDINFSFPIINVN